ASGEGEANERRNCRPHHCTSAHLSAPSVHSSKDAIGARPAERSDASLSFHIGRSRAHEHADAPHPLRLPRERRERPSDHRTAECDQQFPPSDGGCHTPLPCEVRKGKDTTLRACCLNSAEAGRGALSQCPLRSESGPPANQKFWQYHSARDNHLG